MTNINIEITPELQEIIKDTLRSGLYKDTGEFIRELIRKHYFYSDLYQIKLQNLKKALANGLQDALDENYSSITYEDVIARKPSLRGEQSSTRQSSK
jgi:Arc/MetJ-type ribon-helix-helix transcriptional regulator